VCPWNRGVERRRAGLAAESAGRVDLLGWLAEGEGPSDEALRRLYVPRNDSRYLRRNALVAFGNVGDAGGEGGASLRRHADGDDALLAEHARWALERIEARCG
jgi:epoxyqueuosine reductase